MVLLARTRALLLQSGWLCSAQALPLACCAGLPFSSSAAAEPSPACEPANEEEEEAREHQRRVQEMVAGTRHSPASWIHRTTSSSAAQGPRLDMAPSPCSSTPSSSPPPPTATASTTALHKAPKPSMDWREILRLVNHDVAHSAILTDTHKYAACSVCWLWGACLQCVLDVAVGGAVCSACFCV